MNTVNFFGHEISKLIIGDNPMTGHSYIENVITGQEMLDFYTAERIKEAMFRMEECGYTAMLPLAKLREPKFGLMVISLQPAPVIFTPRTCSVRKATGPEDQPWQRLCR